MSSRRETIGVAVFAAGIAMLVAGLALGVALTTGALAQETMYTYHYLGGPPLNAVTLPRQLPEEVGEGASGRALIQASVFNGSMVLAVRYGNHTRIMVVGNQTSTAEIFGVWRVEVSSLSYSGGPILSLNYTIYVEEYPVTLYLVDAVLAIMGAVLAASGMPHVVGRLTRRW